MFKAGDIVRLKFGGPNMMVNGTCPGMDYVMVTYFNNNNDLKETTVDISIIEHVSKEITVKHYDVEVNGIPFKL